MLKNTFSITLFPAPQHIFCFCFCLFPQKLPLGMSRSDSNINTQLFQIRQYSVRGVFWRNKYGALELFFINILKQFFSRTWTLSEFLISDEDASVERVLRWNLRWHGTMGVSGEIGVSTQSGSRLVESSASLSSLKPIAHSSSSTSHVWDVFNEFC